jgi:hypothetical protein
MKSLFIPMSIDYDVSCKGENQNILLYLNFCRQINKYNLK